MFYTLVSRSIITKINTPRDYFYIFLIGSVGYVVLHWYLHMDKRAGIVEKVREYLYYAMVFDVITAYALMMMYPAKADKKITDNNEESKDSSEEQYTPEHKKAIMQKMQEARRLQQMRQKQIAEQTCNQTHVQPNEQPINIDKRKVDKYDKEAVDSGKRSIFTKSEESKESHDTESKSKSDEKKADQKKEKDKSTKQSSSPATKSDIKVKGKNKDLEIQDTEIQVYEGQPKENPKLKKVDK